MDRISLTFNEEMDETSATEASNYEVPGLSVREAVFVGNKVVLMTAEQTPGKTYSVGIKGVKDVAGNALTTDVDVSAFVEATGFLWWDTWTGIGGAHPMEKLTDNENYPNNPTASQLLPFINTRYATGFQGNGNNNYGSRASGILVAPETGEYRFFLRSDDHGQVWISTDENPDNKKLIAEEKGCCKGFTLNDGGLSGLVKLERGKKYYFEALLKEGGGGDWMMVQWRRPSEVADFDKAPWNASGIDGRHFLNHIPAGAAGYGSGEYVSGGSVKTIAPTEIYSQGVVPGSAEGLTVREFHGIGGNRLADNLFTNAKWPNSPDLITHAPYAEWPQTGNIAKAPAGNIKDNYAVHMLGYVTPPDTGDYQFFVAADDNAVLFLSSDESPANKKRIACEPQWRAVRAYANTGNRWVINEDGLMVNGSDPVSLQKGKHYFIEAIMKEGGGGDNLAISWIKAGDDYPADGALPIAGEHLSPWLEYAAPEVPDYWYGMFGLEENEEARLSPKGLWSFSGITEAINPPIGNALEPVRTKWSKMFTGDDSIQLFRRNNFLRAHYDLPPNGFPEAKRINQYSLVYDIRTPLAGRWVSLLNTDHDKPNTPELWITPKGSVGGYRKYSKRGVIKPGVWHRLVYVVDLANNTRKYFVDGELVLSVNKNNRHSKDKALLKLDGRDSLDTTALAIAGDKKSIYAPIEIARVAFYDTALNDEDAEILSVFIIEELEKVGRSNDPEDYYFQPLTGVSLSIVVNPEEDMFDNLQRDLVVIDSELRSGTWTIQVSSNLLNWTDWKSVELDEGLGYVQLPELDTEGQLFYRAKSEE